MSELQKNKFTRVLSVISNLPRALSLIWASGKGWTLAQVALLILRGVFPAALVYLTKLFVDALVAAIAASGNRENINALIWIGGLFAAITIVNELLASVIQMIHSAHSEKLQDHIYERIHERSIKADLAFYEQPEFFDHLHRARSEAKNRPVELLGQLGNLLQNTVTLVAMGVVLVRFGFWLPLLLLISALPAFYVVLRHNLLLHVWSRKNTVEERRTWYHDWLLTNGETAAELRLFGLGGHFRAKFITLRERLRKERLTLAVRQRFSELLASVAALILAGLAFILIIWRTINGAGTLGDLALFYQAFNQGQNLARSFLQEAGRLYANSLFIGDLFEFLALEPSIVSPTDSVPAPATLNDGIRFENVTFRYQNTKRTILRDFDLFIPANKKVAVVGANGAGKSTLIKLICRFYDPENGCVKIDGTDIREFALEDLRRRITVLFQTPVHYSKTVSENIRFGSIDTENLGHAEVEAAARSAGAHSMIERLPDGYDQMLGHWFPDGTELSVGEWQRLSLARAFLRQTSLILLDEPTSSMDPWAEADWLDRFVRETAGKTVVIITHRFTTAMRADLIYVMDNGAIIESGSHQELLSKNGRYAESWNGQMKQS